MSAAQLGSLGSYIDGTLFYFLKILIYDISFRHALSLTPLARIPNKHNAQNLEVLT
jgi:hypothetical protein